MGIVERRERLRNQVRSDIVKTAKEIAREDGWTAVSILRSSKMHLGLFC
jgi:hypothetical protein